MQFYASPCPPLTSRGVSQFAGGGGMLSLITWSEGKEGVLSLVRKDSSLVECPRLLSPKVVQIHISMCFPVLTTITLCLCLSRQVSQSQWTSDSQVCEPFALSWPKQFLSLPFTLPVAPWPFFCCKHTYGRSVGISENARAWGILIHLCPDCFIEAKLQLCRGIFFQ